MNPKMNTSADSQYRKMTETPVAKLILSLGIPTTVNQHGTNEMERINYLFQRSIKEKLHARSGIWYEYNNPTQ